MTPSHILLAYQFTTATARCHSEYLINSMNSKIIPFLHILHSTTNDRVYPDPDPHTHTLVETSLINNRVRARSRPANNPYIYWLLLIYI